MARRPLSLGDVAFLVALSLLAVGLKNFNPGLSIDGPLYASVARHVADLNAWARLDSGTPQFSPFFEHPHLFFWITGLWLKVFPADDWAVRIPTHLCYFATLAMGYASFRRTSQPGLGIAFALALLLQPAFAAWHANAYLDPLFLALAIGALVAANREYARLAGLLLALAAMTKGLTVLAVGPAFLFLLASGHGARGKKVAQATATFTATLALYFLLVTKVGGAEDFFSSYFQRQFANRFAHTWTIGHLFSGEYFVRLFHDTSGLILFVVADFVRRRDRFAWALSLWVLFFWLMYAGAERSGGQYALPFQVASAFAFARFLGEVWPRVTTALASEGLRPRLAYAALLVVALVQYTPIRVQAQRPPEDFFRLRSIFAELGCRKVLSKLGEDWMGVTSRVAWYAHVTLLPETRSAEAECIVGGAPAEATPVERQRFPQARRVGAYWVLAATSTSTSTKVE